MLYRISNMEQKYDIRFLKSTYFNSPAGKHIQPSVYYITMPVVEVKKLEEKNNLEDFLMHTYSKVFYSPEGLVKMQDDLEQYLFELDKRSFME